jgi:ABC-type transporter MlaC component
MDGSRFPERTGRRQIRRAAAVAAILLAGAAMPAAIAQTADSPEARIRQTNAAILEAYDNVAEPDAATEARVYEVMNDVTDFATLSSDAIDDFCVDLAAETCERFKETFSELLRSSAVRKLGRYRADRFDYLGEQIDGDTARVRTVAYYESDGIELDYYMRRSDGVWRIVNYVIDGIDTVVDYRKQLARMLRDRSAEEVIEQLERRIRQLREDGTAAP